jgi:hypothetical protein
LRNPGVQVSATFRRKPDENGPCIGTTEKREYPQAFPERQIRMDTLSPKERSERMGRVKGKDTKPELVVRSLVHRLGFRWMPKSRRDFWEPKQEEPKT